MIFACLFNVHLWHCSDLIDHNGSRGAIAGYWASDLWIKNSLAVSKKLLHFIVSVTPVFSYGDFALVPLALILEMTLLRRGALVRERAERQDNGGQAETTFETVKFERVPTEVQGSVALGLSFSLLTAQISLNPPTKVQCFTKLESACWGWIAAHLQQALPQDLLKLWFARPYLAKL